MTRNGRTHLVVALPLRWPAEPCSPGTGTAGIAPEIPDEIDTAVRQFRWNIGTIGNHCLSSNPAHGPYPNTPKHKSP